MDELLNEMKKKFKVTQMHDDDDGHYSDNFLYFDPLMNLDLGNSASNRKKL